MTRLDEYAEAKKATQIAFAARFPGGGLVPLRVRYAGGFPYKDVAARADVPDVSDLREHKEAWANLYAEFEAAWRRYVEAA